MSYGESKLNNEACHDNHDCILTTRLTESFVIKAKEMMMEVTATTARAGHNFGFQELNQQDPFLASEATEDSFLIVRK